MNLKIGSSRKKSKLTKKGYLKIDGNSCKILEIMLAVSHSWRHDEAQASIKTESN